MRSVTRRTTGWMDACVAIRRLLTQCVLGVHEGDDAGASDLRDASHTNGSCGQIKTDTDSDCERERSMSARCTAARWRVIKALTSGDRARKAGSECEGAGFGVIPTTAGFLVGNPGSGW